MAPFRLARPRLIAVFTLELALIVLVMSGLASLTLQLSPDIDSTLRAASVLTLSGLFCVTLLVTQSANLGDKGSFRREMFFFALFSLVLGLFTFSLVWLLFPEHRVLPAVLALEGAIAVPLALGLWRWLSRSLDVLNAHREAILILGTGETARQICREIVSHHDWEYAVVGFADETPSRLGSVLAMGARIQTDYDSLGRFCPQRVDRVLVALEEKRGRLPVLPLMELRLRGIQVEEATSFFERISGKISVELMLPSWLIFSEGFKSTPMRAFLKRTADLALAVALLVATAPLMLMAALAIKLDSRGPVFYRQERLGRDGKPFKLVKFRSMGQDAERESGPTWAARNDPRVTRVGRVIRKLRIDELPQLFNVLRGEMSFVGPRPEREHFIRQLELKIPYYGLRMTAPPGITGWAQVEYGYGASEADALEKLKYDLYYIKNGNLLFDMWIVLKTVKVVLFGTGAR